MKSKEELFRALKLVQLKICAYRSAIFCDCKYGITEKTMRNGEQTGCPEVRELIAMLSVMTDQEFDEIQKRIKQKTSYHKSSSMLTRNKMKFVSKQK